MAQPLHPAASHGLPSFITAPGETDTLMVVMAVILLLGVLGFGILFLRIHSLPERMAHKGHKFQFEIVAVLGLIALFTHMHIFWIAALLLALIDLPDFGTPLNRIAGSAEKMAGINPVDMPQDAPSQTVLPSEIATRQPMQTSEAVRQSADGMIPAGKPELVIASKKEFLHG
ncbi:MAG: hypothetical protein ACJ8F3_04150 [Xanthobacteraceae bacterium]